MQVVFNKIPSNVKRHQMLAVASVTYT